MAVTNDDYLRGLSLLGTTMGVQGLPQALQNGVTSTLEYLFPDPDRQVASVGNFDKFSGLLARAAVESAIYSYSWNTPFEEFTEPLPYGSGKLMTALETPEMGTFDAKRSDLLVRDYGKPHQKFAPINFEPRKSISISANILKTSLLTEGQMSSYMDAQADTLTNGDRIASYIKYMETIKGAVLSGKMANIHVDIADPEHPTAQELETLSIMVRKYAQQMGVVPSAAYNMAGVTTVSTPDNLRALVTPDFSANLAVKVLANAFNMSQTGVQQRLLTIDHMPVNQLYMILCDKRWLRGFRQIRTIQAMPFDPSTQSFNLSLVHREAITVNPFMNAIAFSAAPTTLREKITVTPPTGITATLVADDGQQVTEWDPRSDMPLHIVVKPTGGSITPDIAPYIIPSGHTTTVSTDAAKTLTTATYVDNFDTVHFQSRGLKDGQKLTFTVTSRANDNVDDTLTDAQQREPLTTTVDLTIKIS